MSAICSGTTRSADDGDEQHVAAAELHPGERVGRERRDRDRDHRGRDRDREAVEERVPEALRLERQPVVLERPLPRRGRDARAPSTIRCVSTSASGRNDVISTPTVGISQRTTMTEDRDPHEPRRPCGPRRCPSPCACGLDAAAAGSGSAMLIGSSSCSRNRLTFQTITGMTAMNRITAIAAPRPSCPLRKNQSDHPLGDHHGPVRLGVAHHEDDVEDLHRVDHHVGGDHDDRRQDARDDDPPEDLELGCAVDAGRLDDLVGDRLDRRRQHDHREPGLHPDHDHHQQEVVPRLDARATRPGSGRGRA